MTTNSLLPSRKWNNLHTKKFKILTIQPPSRDKKEPCFPPGSCQMFTKTTSNTLLTRLPVVTRKSWLPSRKWTNLPNKNKILINQPPRHDHKELASLQEVDESSQKNFKILTHTKIKILTNQPPCRDKEELASLQEVVKCS
jgi:hypothetical protein